MKVKMKVKMKTKVTTFKGKRFSVAGSAQRHAIVTLTQAGLDVSLFIGMRLYYMQRETVGRNKWA